jgi:hypothetical protein
MLGYLRNTDIGLIGNCGMAYDYITAGNGLWCRAETPHTKAVVQLMECPIRGLADIAPALVMKHGLIPQRFMDLALSVMFADPLSERYAAIRWENGWSFYNPIQVGAKSMVNYLNNPDIVFEMHSHGTMKPFYSPQDNTDEQGLRVYAVIGSLHEIPSIRMRVGVYGYFQEVNYGDVFDGSLPGAVQARGEESESESFSELLG